MFLLTTGPHLYYIDPVNMELKGQIPWDPTIFPEPKNFKTFFVHTVSIFPIVLIAYFNALFFQTFFLYDERDFKKCLFISLTLKILREI